MTRNQFPLASAPQRYAEMGLPDEYKISIVTDGVLYGYEYGGVHIQLKKWTADLSWRGKVKGHSWKLLYAIPLSSSVYYWEAEKADAIALSWIYEINRKKRLKEQA